MAANLRRSGDLLPLSPPVLYVLLAVADRPRHGYAIMQEVDRRTQGRINLLPGSLYSTIKRMLSQGLIEEEGVAPRGESDDERRRYYRITADGRATAAAEMERLAAVVDFAKEKKVLPSQVAEARTRS